ncbi:hypothetical protein K466DRAFT_507120 [Polyporus arcularius HHB13444]|uniref:SWIM-type domain-containing protein n=1 Tax=Polyporus arcularius HHB13444 TaxID=1314778 RepID=A0A5C3NPN6_9APHY|nr:hypothetical protein K466DRAFT_507120 [Polyporus arcularius HHB13444]
MKKTPVLKPTGFRKFLYVGQQEARREEVPLTALRSASDVYLDKLCTAPDQLRSIEELYKVGNITDHQYDPRSGEDQLAAAAVMAEIGLDLDARESLANRWSTHWSRETGTGEKETSRTLYQCNCGYHHKARNSKTRTCPVPYTGCLAHVEVLFEVRSGRIRRIRGYFMHNQECKDALFTRIPPIPLSPAVYAHALKQLQGGAQLSDVQDENRRLFKAQEYPGQPQDLAQSPYRWLIRSTDTRSLYRQFNRLRGINTAVAAHVNVDEWLNPRSSLYKPTFADAVFHYSARAAKGERFEVCIATQDMRTAAWKYSHGSQMILDGTFGLCDRKVLLFIVMGIDEKARGVPLAFLMFSAPSGNQHTAAGYNTAILTKLLSAWRTSLGTRNDASFTPRVVITDTDFKERGALLSVFPELWLLICKFHLRQSWRNHRARVVKGTGAYHDDVRARLRRLELALIETEEYKDAVELVSQERELLGRLDEPESPECHAAIMGGFAHLDYLSSYWLQEALWKSWSAFGRRVAADLIGCDVKGILPTTNHLESFNGVLKRKHIRRWQRGGRRLRVDVLLHIFVFSVLPSIFEARALEQVDEQQLLEKIKALPGGAALVRQHAAMQERLAQDGRQAPHGGHSDVSRGVCAAYLAPDVNRDQAAQDLLEHNQISAPVYQDHTRTFVFECFSSMATIADLSPVVYLVRLGLDRTASCTCLDFKHRGGACKHMRAALLRLEELRNSGLQDLPQISLPRTETEARTITVVAVSTTPQGAALGGAQGFEAPSSSGGSQSPVERAAQFVEELLRESGDAVSNNSPKASESESSEDSDLDRDTASLESSLTWLGVHPQPSATTSHSRVAATHHAGAAILGLHRQVVARVLHELAVDAPRMRQLGESLSGVRLLPSEVDRVEAAKGDIDVLAHELSRLLIEARSTAAGDPEKVPTAPTSPTPMPSLSDAPVPLPTPLQPSARPPASAPAQSRKRRANDSLRIFPVSPNKARKVILPPSPEKSQKRQESHGIH